MVMESLKKIGGRFAFEFFLEEWKPSLVEALRKWLRAYSADDVRKMVAKGRYPNTSKLDFSALADYHQYIEKIPIERLVEDFIAPARPDLFEAIQEMGMPGAKWLVKLRLRLLDKVKQLVKPEEAAVLKEDMVMAKCDDCGKSWPVSRDEFSKIETCPFCGHGKNAPSPEKPS